jgi:hypothetical protein
MQSEPEENDDSVMEELPHSLDLKKVGEALGAGDGFVPSTAIRKMSYHDSLEKESIEAIEKQVLQLVDGFLETSYGFQTMGEVRMSHFNVYEVVFNCAILSCMDSWECFPDLHFYWDTWQGLVALRIESNQTVFRQILSALQLCTDLLMRNDHLYEPVLIDTPLASKIGPNVKIQPYTLPFLIMTIQVPKNFIKKLVGYQER